MKAILLLAALGLTPQLVEAQYAMDSRVLKGLLDALGDLQPTARDWHSDGDELLCLGNLEINAESYHDKALAFGRLIGRGWRHYLATGETNRLPDNCFVAPTDMVGVVIHDYKTVAHGFRFIHALILIGGKPKPAFVLYRPPPD